LSSDPAAQLREARAEVLSRDGLSGASLREALTQVADAWLGPRVGEADGVALVAVGGYGRREPAAGSDLDLVLLHRDGVDVEELANSIWYPIWDAGVGLDHSVRTVEEAVGVAREDLKAILGLLDLRHVCGDEALTAELRGRVFDTWRRDARRRLPELVDAVEERGERVGELASCSSPTSRTRAAGSATSTQSPRSRRRGSRTRRPSRSARLTAGCSTSAASCIADRPGAATG
jgi:[protein-PII] uridylyltransferase